MPGDRCQDPTFAIYTCSHEPFVYTLGGPPEDPASWARWIRKRRLRGHGKIGLARSRDLLHWRVPGDLRD
jgi:hypothetical protein